MARWVPLAVMPEGVEHTSVKNCSWVGCVVPLAVMPEGVEHLFLLVGFVVIFG